MFFYNKCLKNAISEEEIQFKADGTTPLKLVALPKLVRFFHFSKMTVVYNGGRPKLAVDRLAGTTNYCLGFVEDNNYYVPSSCLLDDIRNYGENPSQILAILSKEMANKSKVYKKICYVAKGVPLNRIMLPEKLKEIIDLWACLWRFEALLGEKGIVGR